MLTPRVPCACSRTARPSSKVNYSAVHDGCGFAISSDALLQVPYCMLLESTLLAAWAEAA